MSFRILRGLSIELIGIQQVEDYSKIFILRNFYYFIIYLFFRIYNAKYFVYIAGWSVNVKIRLGIRADGNVNVLGSNHRGLWDFGF